MKAYLNNQGIRFVGVMGFQTTQPKGTLDKILDALKATKLRNGKRVRIESADQCVTYHNVPDADAIRILTDHGIAVNLADNDSFPASEATMATFSLRLLFVGDGRSIEPRAHVQVDSSTGQEYNGKLEEDLISSECVSQAEFDHEIDRLKAELETIRKQAHVRFAEARLAASDNS